ncbi:hypothetical protein QZH41_020059 [Actinostola sp. cb2023]|nr:hypothetical protein QZH41_020059 [Actinostola sp. cb2023]
MASEGLSKIRYVGAWAVAKVFHKELKYVRLNMASHSQKTLASVKKSFDMTYLLEEHVIANIAQLQESTKYPPTLNLTEERQYRSRGLTHIEDSAYEFFVELEVLRVDNLNDSKLKKKKETLIDDALKIAFESEVLLNKWQSCFPQEDGHVIKEDIVNTLLKLVVKKYMKAGAGQYLRDFRLAHRIKKSAEHRKKVLERKTALEVTKASVSYADIVGDTTAGKVNSHHRLVAFVAKFGEAAFVKVYLKCQLLTICKAYGITSSQGRATKADLGKQLMPILKSSQSMVHSYYLGNLQSQVNIDSENQRVSLTITRSRLH